MAERWFLHIPRAGLSKFDINKKKECPDNSPIQKEG